MFKSQIIKLDPTHDQEVFFQKCVGTSRFAWNWALEEWRKQYSDGGKPNEGSLRKKLNEIKGEKFLWMYEVPKGIIQQSIKNLGTAYKNYFNSVKGKRKGPKISPPDFKLKNKSKKSARLDDGSGRFKFDGKFVKLPKIGWVKMHEKMRFDKKPMSVIVSNVGDRWWLTIKVELPDVKKNVNPESSVGIDLGLTTAITLSNGEKYEAPKPLKEKLKKLRLLNKNLSRKEKGSQNREKSIKKLSRLHWRIGQIRKDWQHKMTTSIAKRFSVVCVEDLNIRGLVSNRRLTKSVLDIGFGEILEQLSQKCDHVQKVGRFFPSSKLCNKCGEKNNGMDLNTREWTCKNCGSHHDRDVNAAKNVKNEGIRLYTASYAEINACGVEGSDDACKSNVKPSTVNQESYLSLRDIK